MSLVLATLLRDAHIVIVGFSWAWIDLGPVTLLDPPYRDLK